MKVVFLYSHSFQRALLTLPFPSLMAHWAAGHHFPVSEGVKVKSSLHFNLIFNLAFVPSG